MPFEFRHPPNMVKLDPTKKKLPARKMIIYLMIVLLLILIMVGWNRLAKLFFS